MPQSLNIQNTQLSDLSFIYGLFDQSISYQEAKGFPVWRNYDKSAILRDIENGNHYKALSEGTIAIVFGVNYHDKLIWRGHDTGEAIYLHRIVVNPAFKGQKLFGKILDWALQHIQERGLRHIRMDTWASNPAIIKYYQRFGFEIVENFTTPDSEELPVHNRNLELALMEYRGPRRER